MESGGKEGGEPAGDDDDEEVDVSIFTLASGLSTGLTVPRASSSVQDGYTPSVENGSIQWDGSAEPRKTCVKDLRVRL